MEMHDEGVGQIPDQDYGQANETAARLVAYLGPYLFWGTVGAILGGIWLLQ